MVFPLHSVNLCTVNWYNLIIEVNSSIKHIHLSKAGPTPHRFGDNFERIEIEFRQESLHAMAPADDNAPPDRHVGLYVTATSHDRHVGRHLWLVADGRTVTRLNSKFVPYCNTIYAILAGYVYSYTFDSIVWRRVRLSLSGRHTRRETCEAEPYRPINSRLLMRRII